MKRKTKEIVPARPFGDYCVTHMVIEEERLRLYNPRNVLVGIIPATDAAFESWVKW